MSDFFPTMEMKPNPQCTNKKCKKRQTEYQKLIHSKSYLEKVRIAEEERLRIEAEEKAKPLHDDNEWNIEVVDEDASVIVNADSSINKDLPSGLKYEMPVAENEEENEESVEVDGEADDLGLDDLMSELENIQGGNDKVSSSNPFDAYDEDGLL